MKKRELARLALRIISGRYNGEYLDNETYLALGYDPYRFSYYGRPDDSELKEKAEDILLDLICPPDTAQEADPTDP